MKSCNISGLAIHGLDSISVAVQKKLPTQQQAQDKLLDESCVTNLHQISDTIGAMVIGLAGIFSSERLIL